MRRLVGGVQNYAWGSHTLLAELRGDRKSKEPEAEIWYGAHPGTATMCDDGTSLLDYIEANPVAHLGHSIVDRFGPKLPFLLKLLAAGSHLSIQAHPSIEQAQVGFAAEEAAGIERTAFNRSFKDDNHKPELICALTPFEALVGFRPVGQTMDFLNRIRCQGILDPLKINGPKSVVEGVLDPSRWGADEADTRDMVAELVGCCEHKSTRDWSAEQELILRLNEKYPGDPGIIVAALLNYITLQPGEALYLGAGNMHAYVSGLGVEIMANSDNVLRGGLTPKHIDVANLLDVVLPDAIEPELVPIDAEGRYLTPAPDFELRRLVVDSRPEVTGPCVVLCTEGTAVLRQGDEEMSLSPTEACWLSVDEKAVVSGSAGHVWLATVGSASSLHGPAVDTLVPG